jgi:hypothetical protein
MKRDDYGRTDRVYNRIDKGEAWPTQPHGGSPQQNMQMWTMLGDMQWQGLIKESDSSWASPIVLVQKKNGDLCFCRLQETIQCQKVRLFPTAPDWRHSEHAGWRQIVLHSGPEEWLLAGGSASGQQGEDWVLDGSRAIAVHSYALWPLQCSSDVLEVNRDRPKRPHLWVMSRVLDDVIMIGCMFQEHLFQTMESVPAVPRSPPKPQSAEVLNSFRRKYGTSGILCHLRG